MWMLVCLCVSPAWQPIEGISRLLPLDSCDRLKQTPVTHVWKNQV